MARAFRANLPRCGLSSDGRSDGEHGKLGLLVCFADKRSSRLSAREPLVLGTPLESLALLPTGKFRISTPDNVEVISETQKVARYTR